MYTSLLQTYTSLFVAACCSVLQRAAVSLLKTYMSLFAHTSPTQHPITLAVCCSVLQCVAVCCSVLQCVAVCCTHLANATPHHTEESLVSTNKFPLQIHASLLHITRLFCKYMRFFCTHLVNAPPYGIEDSPIFTHKSPLQIHAFLRQTYYLHISLLYLHISLLCKYTRFFGKHMQTYASNIRVSSVHTSVSRGGGLGSRPIFKKFHEPYAPS